MSRRQRTILNKLDGLIPNASEHFMNFFSPVVSRFVYKLDPKWGFSNGPSICQCPPFVSDSLVSEMNKGTIVPVPKISKFVGEDQVELTDGTI